MVRILMPSDANAVADMFTELAGDRFFRPHSFDREQADFVSRHQGSDLYCGAFTDSRAIAYGFLRGLDEGFAHPSLGVAVVPSQQGRGIGTSVIDFLHGQAAWRRYTTIRIRVHPENVRARSLYEKLGYMFHGERDRGELVGWKRL